jgi:hypothetical protein
VVSPLRQEVFFPISMLSCCPKSPPNRFDLVALSIAYSTQLANNKCIDLYCE